MLSLDEVILIQDINPSVSDMIIPGNKIKSLQAPINNIIGAYESESTLIKYRGPTGLITPKVSTTIGNKIPIQTEEKNRLEAVFQMQYGLMEGQTHIILADAAVDYTKTGFSIAELGLNDTVVNGTKSIADTIGYPTELLSIVNPTFNNKEAAEKEVYTKFIIPGSKNIAQQFASYFLPLTEKIVFSYDHVPELQPDKLKQYQARKVLAESLKIEFDLDIITQNQMLTKLGEEPFIGGDYRKSEIPPGSVPLAVTLGVGGVQALTQVLADTTISEDAKQSTLEVVFGLTPNDAARMSANSRSQQNNTNQNEQQPTQ